MFRLPLNKYWLSTDMATKKFQRHPIPPPLEAEGSHNSGNFFINPNFFFTTFHRPWSEIHSIFYFPPFFFPARNVKITDINLITTPEYRRMAMVVWSKLPHMYQSYERYKDHRSFKEIIKPAMQPSHSPQYNKKKVIIRRIGDRNASSVDFCHNSSIQDFLDPDNGDKSMANEDFVRDSLSRCSCSNYYFINK